MDHSNHIMHMKNQLQFPILICCKDFSKCLASLWIFPTGLVYLVSWWLPACKLKAVCRTLGDYNLMSEREFALHFVYLAPVVSTNH